MNGKAVDAKRVAESVQVGDNFGGINGQAGRGPWWLTFRHWKGRCKPERSDEARSGDYSRALSDSDEWQVRGRGVRVW